MKRRIVSHASVFVVLFVIGYFIGNNLSNTQSGMAQSIAKLFQINILGIDQNPNQSEELASSVQSAADFNKFPPPNFDPITLSDIESTDGQESKFITNKEEISYSDIEKLMDMQNYDDLLDLDKSELKKSQREVNDVGSKIGDVGVTREVNSITPKNYKSNKSNKNENWNCNCNVNGRRTKELKFEDENKCGESRNYLLSGINELKKHTEYNTYFEDSMLRGKTLPPKCVLYSMYHFFEGSQINPSVYFARCEDDRDKPKKGAFKPCVTQDYFNFTYNSFMDAMDCFKVPVKVIFPKIFIESGFHINAIGSGGDAGVGQLTQGALEDVRSTKDKWRNIISKSDRPSCKRLIEVNDIWNDPSAMLTSLNHRCAVINSPPNPVRNVLYMAILYNNIRIYISNLWSEYKISEKLSKIADPEFREEELKEQVRLLSYNRGPLPAIQALSEWLDYRMQMPNKLIKNADIDMSLQYPLDVLKTRKISLPRNGMSKLAYNRVLAQATLDRKMDLIKSKGFSIDQWSVFLAVYKNNAYLRAITATENKLDQVFGKNICTDFDKRSF